LLDIAGGTVTVSGTNTTVVNGQQGSFLLNTNSNSATTSRPSTGYAGVNVKNGGTLSLGAVQTFQTNTGANLYTSINVTGSGSKITSTGASGFNLNFTSNASNTTTLALHNGGSLETSLISNTGSLSNAYLSFDNGTLKATAADATGLIRSGVTTYIQSGGATIDTNGFSTTVATALQAPTGNGVTSIVLGGTATGYVGAPIVQISGGGGTGAAAIANFDPATGTVTGITITAAGSGYTSAPTITLVGGNGGTTGAGVGTATGTASIGAVTSGGLTKTGTGTLTLSAANTYTGNTTINAGTLTLSSTGSMLFKITDSTNTEILGTGIGTFDGAFKLDLTGVTASNTWTLVNMGSLDVSTSYGGTFSVVDNAGGITFTNNSGVWSGTGATGTYTFTQSTGALSFTAVPEPHEFALAIVALLGVMVFIRRRNQQA
jgi:autotransporter-associated beta strand protein